ncbi:MAG: hypothetical protein PVJ83_07315 [Gammaproteobacteria bacterium]|jgi:hypothetical protein
MAIRFICPVLILSLTALCLSSGSVFAAKAKFERAKPHINVGTLGQQGVSILVTNLRGNIDDPTPCTFSGDLVATDNTPDGRVPEEIYRVRVELAEGASLTVPIPYPYSSSRYGERREIRVDINPAETADRRCNIATAVVGYDNDFQGTQYISPHRVAKIDSFAIKQAIVPVSFIGFAGGNADQVVKVVLTRFDAAEDELLEGRQCDYSGVLMVQGVPILDSEQNEAVSKAYPIKWTGPGFKAVEVPLAELGATNFTRIDLVLSYVVDEGPLAQCANWLDIGVQVIDALTGETRSNQMRRIPAHTPEWGNPNLADPG